MQREGYKSIQHRHTSGSAGTNQPAHIQHCQTQQHYIIRYVHSFTFVLFLVGLTLLLFGCPYS